MDASERFVLYEAADALEDRATPAPATATERAVFASEDHDALNRATYKGEPLQFVPPVKGELFPDLAALEREALDFARAYYGKDGSKCGDGWLRVALAARALRTGEEPWCVIDDLASKGKINATMDADQPARSKLRQLLSDAVRERDEARAEVEKWRGAASALCGEHTGKKFERCPACEWLDARNETRRALNQIDRMVGGQSSPPSFTDCEKAVERIVEEVDRYRDAQSVRADIFAILRDCTKPADVAALARAMYAEMCEQRNPDAPSWKTNTDANRAEWMGAASAALAFLRLPAREGKVEIDRERAINAYYSYSGSTDQSLHAAIDDVLAQLGEQRGSA